MTDSSKLREALGDWKPDGPTHWETKATVINAASEYLALLEGGEKVHWCQSHNAELEMDSVWGAQPCRKSHSIGTDCRMVERFLIPLSNPEGEK